MRPISRSILCLTSLIILFVSIQLLAHCQTLDQEVTKSEENGTDKPKNMKIQLPKIFDWDRYKAAFRKIYPSIKDELARKKLFVANALKTFLHNLAFRLGKTSHYQSVNQFTDNTPEEVRKRYSTFKPKIADTKQDIHDADDDDKQIDETSGLDIDNLKQMLSKIIEDKQPGYEILARQLEVTIDDYRSRRVARSLDDEQRGILQVSEADQRSDRRQYNSNVEIKEFRSMVDEPPPRESSKYVDIVPPVDNHHHQQQQHESSEEFMADSDSTSQSIDFDFGNHLRVKAENRLPEQQKLSLLEKIPGSDFVKRQFNWLSGVFKKITDDDSSNYDENTNNEINQSTKVEDDMMDSESEFPSISRDESKNKKKITYRRKNSNKKQEPDYSKMTLEAKRALLGIMQDNVGSDGNKPEDKAYVDYREDGCLTTARDQDTCGSCYAFAIVALMEWWHCSQTGKLVPFSEQYIVDCGRYSELDGCGGGDTESMERFVRDWGVELRAKYPYLAEESQCPYEKDDWDKAGYKRPAVLSYALVSQRSLWPAALKLSGPMLAVIRVPKDFDAYGGMVHEGHNCYKRGGYHAMLLVGHGIEDGDEYWLFKNSHGHYWGENGFFKLSKQAKEHCFYEVFDTTFDFKRPQPKPIEIEETHGRKKITRKLTPSEAHSKGLIKY